MIVGKRRCRKCGCYWLPPWSKSTVWLALGFVEFSVVLMVILILFVESPFLWNGEFSAKYAQAPKEAVKSLGLIILLILLGFGTLKYFIPYFKGKKGQGQVLEVGLFNEAQAAAQAAKQEEKK
ncbi:MAG: hypothetical protein HZA50_15605 [Planctomycetes bacterium]|nr:hypothetical protein [Planctomycetota bacterium]